MMKIVIASNSISGGGAERTMNLLANKLVSKGHLVSTICINRASKDLIENKSRVIQLSRNWNDGILPTLREFFNFYRAVRSLSPEILILNCELPEMYGAFAPSVKKLVCVEHVNNPWINRKLVGFFIRKLLQIRGATWVAVSGHLMIWPHGLKPKAVIENIVTEDIDVDIPFSSNDRTIGQEKLERLVFIGRLNPQKQPQVVMQVANKLKVPSVFIGQGKLQSELEWMSRSNQAASKFLGFVENPWTLIQRGDLVLVPSLFEGDGLVVVEAILKNVPLLVSDIQEFRYFGLPEKHYCLNVDEFCETIRKYFSDINLLRVETLKRTEIMKTRSSERIYGLWEKLLGD